MKLKILGPIEAELNNERLDLGGEKQQSVLLALVLAEGRVIGTDRLINLVWGDRPPAKPNVTLRSYISHLRKILEPGHRTGNGPQLLVTRSGGYAFEGSPERVDAYQFRVLADKAKNAAANAELRQAVEFADSGLKLWRTQSLADGPMKAFLRDAESLTETRNQLIETKLRSLLGLGEDREGIDQARQFIIEHPYNQTWREILMLGLYATGRTVEALAEYQSIRLLLVEDLGLEPGPILQQLERQILANNVPLLGGPTPDTQIRDTQIHGASASIPTSPANGHDQKNQADSGSAMDGLVGRDHEIEKLDLFLDGPGGCVAVMSGEPGIGKTTLANYIVDKAKREGHVSAWGRCHDGGQTSAYWPWSTVLRDLLDPLEDTAFTKVLGHRPTDLGSLLGAASRTESGHASDPSGGSIALHDAVTQLLIRRSAVGRCLLVFEDLHWADIGTLKLLNFAIPALQNHDIRIVATWRTTERGDQKLRGELADLARLAGSTRLPLVGLSAPAVAELYRYTRHEVSPDGFEVELQARTDGNPLFVTELLHSADPGVAVTGVPTIGEAIERRVAALAPGSRELLRIGALCPTGFRESLLSQVLDTDHEEVLDRIEDAMAARILEEDPASNIGFRFTHSLIAEQLVSSLAPDRRAAYHAKIGQILANSSGAPSQLAYHYLRGANAGTAVLGAKYALLAGREASKLFDHIGAAKLVEDGLEALSNAGVQAASETPPNAEAQSNADAQSADTQSVGDSASSRRDYELVGIKADLLAELAQTTKNLEQYERTQSLAQASFDAALLISDPERMLNAALAFSGQARISNGSFTGQWLGYWSPPEPSRAMFAACIDRLAPGDPLRIRAMMGYTTACYDVPDDARATSMVDLAISEARDQDSESLLAETLLSKLQTRQRSLSVQERQALADEATVIALEIGSLGLEVAGRSNNIVISLDQRSPDMAFDQIRILAGLGRKSDAPRLTLWAESMDLSLAIFQGRFGEAEERLQIAFSEYAKYGNATIDILGLQLSTLYREIGRTDDVIEMMKWKLAGYPGAAFAAPLAALYAEAGRTEEAVEVIGEHKSAALFDGGENVLQFVTPTLYSEVVVQTSDAAGATQLYRTLLPSSNRVVAMLHAAILLGSGSLPLGRLATVLGNFDVAEAHLSEAQDLHRALGSRPYELRTTAAMAVLGAAKGDRSKAMQNLDEAQTCAAELGMQWLTVALPERVDEALETHAAGAEGS